MTSTILQNRQPRPLSFKTSIFSLTKNRSLIVLKTSSTSSFRADLFVCDATKITGERSADGNWRRSFLAVFSDSRASANVNSGRPVSPHCQMTEFVSMHRSKNSLKKFNMSDFGVVKSVCVWGSAKGALENSLFTVLGCQLTRNSWILR